MAQILSHLFFSVDCHPEPCAELDSVLIQDLSE